jgi:hypothetical protein
MPNPKPSAPTEVKEEPTAAQQAVRSIGEWWDSQGRLFVAGMDVATQRLVMGTCDRAWHARDAEVEAQAEQIKDITEENVLYRESIASLQDSLIKESAQLSELREMVRQLADGLKFHKGEGCNGCEDLLARATKLLQPSKCRWCDEGRPWMEGQEGKQHVPLYAGGEHSGTMCHNNQDVYPVQPQDVKEKG